MEGMIGEIRMFTGDFAPKGWEFCRGQTLYISTNETLFTIIGVAFGGDGVETFNLPNLSGRVAIGAGQGAGLTNRVLGTYLGTETVVLTQEHLPTHSHQFKASFTASPPSVEGELQGINGNGGQVSPAGNYIGKDTEAGSIHYATAASNQVAMNQKSIVINSLMSSQPHVTVSGTAVSEPHSNVQPVLAANFIICIEGIYPSRGRTII